MLDQHREHLGGVDPARARQALDDGRIRDGDLVLFVGFGAGMTAASAVVRWSSTGPPRTAQWR